MKIVDKIELSKITVLGFLLVICLLSIYYFHFVLKTEVVFTHFFYVPIILASLWWSRRGIAVAAFLGLLLLVSHILSSLESLIWADVTRASMFLIVGTVVAILNAKMLALMEKLRLHGEIVVKAYVGKGDDNLHIELNDTGIGIPKEHINNLFDRFYQGDASTKRKYGGTGAGLHISKLIVEAHKGKIWAESEDGVGTTIHFTLPM